MNIETMLEKIAQREGIIDAYFENPLKSEKGHGYLSHIIAVYIKGKSKSGKETTLSLIIKTAATNDKLRESSAVAQVFGREIFMYKVIFPAYYKFEEAKGILKPFVSVPKCYDALAVNSPEVLIMENLKEKGYQVWDRRLEMEDDHVRLVLTEYGRFHATSFAIQDQKPEYFKKLTVNFDNMFDIFLNTSGFNHTFINKARKAQASLDPKKDEYYFRRYEAFLDGVETKFKDLVRCNDEHRAILHGDCWSNNMMFKYEDIENPKLPTAIRLIDFQFARLGSPVCDLMYFFYPCSSKKVLKNLNIYKRVYYDSFEEHLRKLGSNPERVYPFSIFEEHWQKYAHFGLVVSSLLRYMMLIEENEAVDFTDVLESGTNISNAFDYEISNISKYYERMRNVIVHCVENNFI